MTSNEFRPWSVVVVPFPYSERLAEKRRPALVVSNDRLHQDGFLWIAMITGAGKARRTGDIEVRDLTKAGLPGDSLIRTSKLTTVEPGRIIRTIGVLAAGERSKVARAIAGFLAS